jgi:hypothetical protein
MRIPQLYTRYIDERNVTAEFQRFAADDSPALIIHTEQGEPLAKPFVCLDRPPPANCAWVKEYSENEGMAKALKIAGILADTIPVDLFHSGHVLIAAYPLTEAALAELPQPRQPRRPQ